MLLQIIHTALIKRCVEALLIEYFQRFFIPTVQTPYICFEIRDYYRKKNAFFLPLIK